ncbi:hypothetical protein FNV43_RR11615 [Rhamnella rubrinervis]|uniref:Uncharacterized protein n=1 Tax=Rhamnella rubrinervis TaxID=2594499 RepID=A0A8K0MHS9_9ROSA|nr:hypothetical protein FNV43_RR11615 [Rhamnella rubrinervis]
MSNSDELTGSKHLFLMKKYLSFQPLSLVALRTDPSITDRVCSFPISWGCQHCIFWKAIPLLEAIFIWPYDTFGSTQGIGFCSATWFGSTILTAELADDGDGVGLAERPEYSRKGSKAESPDDIFGRETKLKEFLEEIRIEIDRAWGGMKVGGDDELANHGRMGFRPGG